MNSRTQTERQLLSCSICLETLQEPKVLSCLHRFCESCLNNHITMSFARSSNLPRGFSCPECRKFIPAPDTGTPSSSWAAQFQTDFHMKLLIDLYKARQEPQKNTELHRSGQEPQKNYESTIIRPCPEHREAEVNLYCVGCSAAVCHRCVVTSHHRCGRFLTANKAAQDRRSRLQEQINSIQPIIDEALTHEKLRELYMKEVDEKVVLVDKEIRELARKVHAHVYKQREELLKELHKSHEDLQQNVSATFATLSVRVHKLQRLVQQTKLKMASSLDVDVLLDTNLNDCVDSCSEQCAAVNKQYDSLCNMLSNVKCVFAATSSSFSLGNLLFLSGVNDINGFDHPAPSNSQTAKFSTSSSSHTSIHPTPSSSQTSMFSTPSSSQTSMFSTPSSSQTSMFSTPSSSQTSMFSTPSSSQTSMFSTPSSSQTSMFSTPSSSQTSIFSTTSSSQTSMFSTTLRSQTALFLKPSHSQTAMCSTPSSFHTSMLSTSLGSQTSILSTPSSSQTSMFSTPLSSQTSMFSTPSSSQTSMFSTPLSSQTSMFSTSLRNQTSTFARRSMPKRHPRSTNHLHCSKYKLCRIFGKSYT